MHACSQYYKCLEHQLIFDLFSDLTIPQPVSGPYINPTPRAANTRHGTSAFEYNFRLQPSGGKESYEPADKRRHYSAAHMDMTLTSPV